MTMILRPSQFGDVDIVIEDQSVVDLPDDLTGPAILSIFGERRAPGEVGRAARGFFANPTFGSLAWTRDSIPVSNELYELIIEDTRNALQWMIDDGLAMDFTFQRQSSPDPEFLCLQLTITTSMGREEYFRIITNGIDSFIRA